MNDAKTVEICRQMHEVRCSLGEEVEEIVDSARTLTDWRYYIRQYPWLCLAGAAAVGFLVVPKRVELVSPSADVIEELARRHKLVVESSPRAQPKGGLGAALFSLAANALVRGAIGYVGQNAGKLFGESIPAPGDEHAKPNW